MTQPKTENRKHVVVPPRNNTRPDAAISAATARGSRGARRRYGVRRRPRAQSAACFSAVWASRDCPSPVAAFFFRAWLAVMRVVWRQAHFAVGAALVVVAGTGLALLFDWNVALTVTALAVTNEWLFLPTSDLVWMARRGYVSPTCVRLALSAVAAMGADEADGARVAAPEARLVAKLERYRDWQTEEERGGGTRMLGERGGGGVDATPTTRVRRERARRTPTTTTRHRPDPTTRERRATTRLRRGRRAQAREGGTAPRVRDGTVKRPIRIVLRAILRLNGLVPFAERDRGAGAKAQERRGGLFRRLSRRSARRSARRPPRRRRALVPRGRATTPTPRTGGQATWKPSRNALYPTQRRGRTGRCLCVSPLATAGSSAARGMGDAVGRKRARLGKSLRRLCIGRPPR